MNARGGQPQVMEIAARDIHQKYQDFSVFPLLYHFSQDIL